MLIYKDQSLHFFVLFTQYGLSSFMVVYEDEQMALRSSRIEHRKCDHQFQLSGVLCIKCYHLNLHHAYHVHSAMAYHVEYTARADWPWGVMGVPRWVDKQFAPEIIVRDIKWKTENLNISWSNGPLNGILWLLGREGVGPLYCLPDI